MNNKRKRERNERERAERAERTRERERINAERNAMIDERNANERDTRMNMILLRAKRRDERERARRKRANERMLTRMRDMVVIDELRDIYDANTNDARNGRRNV